MVFNVDDCEMTGSERGMENRITESLMLKQQDINVAVNTKLELLSTKTNELSNKVNGLSEDIRDVKEASTANRRYILTVILLIVITILEVTPANLPVIFKLIGA